MGAEWGLGEGKVGAKRLLSGARRGKSGGI